MVHISKKQLQTPRLTCLSAMAIGQRGSQPNPNQPWSNEAIIGLVAVVLMIICPTVRWLLRRHFKRAERSRYNREVSCNINVANKNRTEGNTYL
jgi:hypothetical protein